MFLNDQNFEQEVEKYAGVVLVDFFAAWCGPCRLMIPIIEELETEHHSNPQVKIAKMDVDANRETSEKYGIMSIPTIILFKDGKKVKELVGVQHKDALNDAISNLLSE